MKVAIISTYSNTGNTTIAGMIGCALAYTQDIDVAVTCTTMKNRRICYYLGIETKDDITTNISQISQLIQADAISPEDCKDYMLKVMKHFYVLDTSSDILSPQDRSEIIRKIYSYGVAPITLCDIGSSADVMKDPLTKDIIEESDIIVYCTNPDIKTKQRLDKWRAEGLLPTDKPILLLVNMFDERCASIRDLASLNGFKIKNSIKIHRNPYIQKYANDGKLNEAVKGALLKYDPVIELHQDLKEVCQALMTNAKLRFKWEDN